ncbi:hypothetical protein GQQ20_09900 [Pantoea agglomerans]|nr:hypothetical protein [Pantoea agglomerans]NEG99919.1 hypothetical protein [Pantoea agglomerans]NEH04118.1 hypothetical protein [Pantoea agglomerans]NEH14479.1 hypothetical protein [Pantoea agglomerans]
MRTVFDDSTLCTASGHSISSLSLVISFAVPVFSFTCTSASLRPFNHCNTPKTEPIPAPAAIAAVSLLMPKTSKTLMFEAA